jgi:hypothetical protein
MNSTVEIDSQVQMLLKKPFFAHFDVCVPLIFVPPYFGFEKWLSSRIKCDALC